MRFVLIIGLCFFHSLAAALAVKVSDDNRSVGSGWMIRTSKGVFVLTSEHVLTSLPPKVQVNGQTIKTESMFRDWARGFAVLRPVEAVDEALGTVVSDQELVGGSLNIKERDQVELRAFPAATVAAPVSVSGEIAAVDSCRSFIPAGCGIEVIKTHGEFGMSGGPVLLKGAFAGLISHQVLHIEVGKPSEARIWTGGIASQIFILPRQPIYDVVAGLMGLKPEVLPLAVRVFYSYMLEERLLIGDWLFGSSQGPIRLSGVHQKRAAIGGDGVGIGGDASHHQPIPPVSRMRLFPNVLGAYMMEHQNSRPIVTAPILSAHPHVVESWNKTLRQKDTSGFRHIGSFLDVSRGKGQLRSVAFKSVEEFVRLILRGDHIPIWRPVSESESENPQRARARSEALSHLATLYRPIHAGQASEEYREHYARVHVLLDASNDLNSWLLEPDAFARLLDIRGPHFKGWKAFFAAEYLQTVNLLQSLYALECHYASTCK